jgi:hypothetical protein
MNWLRDFSSNLAANLVAAGIIGLVGATLGGLVQRAIVGAADPVLVALIGVLTFLAVLLLLGLAWRAGRAAGRSGSSDGAAVIARPPPSALPPVPGPSPPNVVLRIELAEIAEPWLEWIHIAADNLGQQVATGAWAEAWIAGLEFRRYRLMWSGAKEAVDLRRGAAVLIPLVIRAHTAAKVYGVELEPTVPYVTDINFLKDHVGRHKLRVIGGGAGAWDGQINVTVHFGNDETASAAFRLTVPPSASGGRMSFSQVS